MRFSIKRLRRKMLRAVMEKVLGIPYETVNMVVYRSDFPDGRITGKPAQIGKFSLIDYGGGVQIGRNVKIGYGVVILSVSSIVGSGSTEILKNPVVIGDNVEIGSNAVILPGVKIGNNTTIGAGTVVTRDVPANVVLVGASARIVKTKQ